MILDESILDVVFYKKSFAGIHSFHNNNNKHFFDLIPVRNDKIY